MFDLLKEICRSGQSWSYRWYRIRELCFHPSPRDRIWWAWATGIMAIAMAISAIFLLSHGHLWTGGANIVLTIWNMLTCWVNVSLYREWKYYGEDDRGA
jgi:hypothetical protein